MGDTHGLACVEFKGVPYLPSPVLPPQLVLGRGHRCFAARVADVGQAEQFYLPEQGGLSQQGQRAKKPYQPRGFKYFVKQRKGEQDDQHRQPVVFRGLPAVLRDSHVESVLDHEHAPDQPVEDRNQGVFDFIPVSDRQR